MLEGRLAATWGGVLRERQATACLDRACRSLKSLRTARVKPRRPRSLEAPPLNQAAATMHASARRSEAVAPRFAVGQLVRARNMNPVGHMRLPCYVVSPRSQELYISRRHQ